MNYCHYQDTDNLWRWQLLDDNGDIIAISGQGHKTQALCQAEIGQVKTSLKAPVVSCEIAHTIARVQKFIKNFPHKS